MLVDRGKYNPNPLTKLTVVIILSMTIMYPMKDIFNIIMVCFFSIMYYLNGYVKYSIRNIIIFLFLIYVPNFDKMYNLNGFVKVFLVFFVVIKLFYLQFMAGRYLIVTSDVGSIISSMDKIKIPRFLSIPIAVIFRFFPSYKEEKKNIKMAMKIRGITPKNPIKYLEYVTIPLLIISTNIADDISKAAETKCIAMPGRKNRYREINFRQIDLIFFLIIIFIRIGGSIW